MTALTCPIGIKVGTICKEYEGWRLFFGVITCMSSLNINVGWLTEKYFEHHHGGISYSAHVNVN